MIRTLKALSLTLGALFAMSAMMASTVSAHTPAVFHVDNADKEPVTITANQKTQHKFTVTGQTVTCEVAEFEGTTKELTPTGIKLAAHYTGCKTGLGTTVNVTGFATIHEEIGQSGKCWYTIAASGTADLECNNADVTVDAGPCVVHIPAQHFPSGVTFSTELIDTEPEDIHDLTVGFEVKNIKGTHTDGFLCPFGSSGESSEAILEGTSTAFAEREVDGELVHLTHTPTVP